MTVNPKIAHGPATVAYWLALNLAKVVAGLVVLATAAFFLVQLAPGDPVLRLLGGSANSEDIQRERVALGLDRPLLHRYGEFMSHLPTLNFGRSYEGQSVSAMLSTRIGPTLELALSALLLAAVLSVVIGMVMAVLAKNDSRAVLNTAYTFTSGTIASIPSYVLAMVLIAAFGVTLRLFPVAGANGPSALVLPAVSIGLPAAAVLSRIIRNEALNVLQSDYVRLARSKQVSPIRLYARHILPNVAAASLTIGGVLFGYLLSGSVIVENVFARPGIGTLMITAVNDRDYPVLQACIVVIGAAAIIVNTAVDIALGVIDPRRKRQR